MGPNGRKSSIRSDSLVSSDKLVTLIVADSSKNRHKVQCYYTNKKYISSWGMQLINSQPILQSLLIVNKSYFQSIMNLLYTKKLTQTLNFCFGEKHIKEQPLSMSNKYKMISPTLIRIFFFTQMYLKQYQRNMQLLCTITKPFKRNVTQVTN